MNARPFGDSGQDWSDGRDGALLVLADGEVFEGDAMGAAPPGGVATGELVFNTVLSGYQEVVTDPTKSQISAVHDIEKKGRVADTIGYDWRERTTDGQSDG